MSVFHSPDLLTVKVQNGLHGAASTGDVHGVQLKQNARVDRCEGSTWFWKLKQIRCFTDCFGPTTSGQKATERALVVDFHLATKLWTAARVKLLLRCPHLKLKARCKAHRHWSSSMINGAKPSAVPTKSTPHVDQAWSPDPRIPTNAETLHHRVCSNLVKMRRKGKFSCKKMILVVGSPENRAWMPLDGFLYWKTSRDWQIQSVQHGWRNLVWRSFLTNVTKQGETWREQCVFYWDCNACSIFIQVSLSNWRLSSLQKEHLQWH